MHIADTLSRDTLELKQTTADSHEEEIWILSKEIAHINMAEDVNIKKLTLENIRTHSQSDEQL